MEVLNIFSGAFVDEMADALAVLMRGRALELCVSKLVRSSMPILPRDCSGSLFF